MKTVKIIDIYSLISEKAFTKQVIDLARWYGWLVFHALPGLTQSGRWRTAMQGDVGFVDLVLARGNQVIFAELKSKNGKLSQDQIEWIKRLTAAGEVYVWRPSDIEAIEYILKRKKPGQ